MPVENIGMDPTGVAVLQGISQRRAATRATKVQAGAQVETARIGAESRERVAGMQAQVQKEEMARRSAENMWSRDLAMKMKQMDIENDKNTALARREYQTAVREGDLERIAEWDRKKWAAYNKEVEAEENWRLASINMAIKEFEFLKTDYGNRQDLAEKLLLRSKQTQEQNKALEALTDDIQMTVSSRTPNANPGESMDTRATNLTNNMMSKISELTDGTINDFRSFETLKIQLEKGIVDETLSPVEITSLTRGLAKATEAELQKLQLQLGILKEAKIEFDHITIDPTDPSSYEKLSMGLNVDDLKWENAHEYWGSGWWDAAQALNEDLGNVMSLGALKPEMELIKTPNPELTAASQKAGQYVLSLRKLRGFKDAIRDLRYSDNPAVRKAVKEADALGSPDYAQINNAMIESLENFSRTDDLDAVMAPLRNLQQVYIGRYEEGRARRTDLLEEPSPFDQLLAGYEAR